MTERAMTGNRVTAIVEGLLFKHRPFVLVAFAVATAIMCWMAAGLRIDAGFTKVVPVEHEYMQTFLEYRDRFGEADRVAIAVIAQDGDMFTPKYFEVLRRVHDSLFFLPGVDRTRVSSIFSANVRYLQVVEDGITAGSVVPAVFQPDAESLKHVRENIIRAGIVGRLVANDFSGALVTARLQEWHPETGERIDYVELSRSLERIRNEVADTGVASAHVLGFATVVGEIASGTRGVIAFSFIAFIITALLVLGFTRSFGRTWPPLACSLVAVVWQIGALTALGFGIDPLSILVPFLVFAIAVSHGVQMVATVHAEAVAGATGLEAARAGVRRLLLPGTIALLSDSIGFLAIWLIEVQVIREMAITASIGVAAIILTNLVLLPILLSYRSIDEEQRQSARTRTQLLGPLWSKLALLTHRRPAAVVIAVSVLLAAVSVYPATQVHVGDTHQGVPELRESSRYNRDVALVRQRFDVGADVLTVVVETVADACVEYEIMSRIDEFEQRIGEVAGVQSVLGLAGIARIVNAGWNEGNLKWRSLPRNRYTLAKAVSPIRSNTGLLNSDCSVMPVYVFTDDHKAETIERVVEAVEAFRTEGRNERIDFRLAAGNVGVMAAVNEEVEASQFPILAYVYAAVIALCLVSFRSITATLCIILPLALVSLLAYALMAALGIGLKISTLPVVALGVGIGIDYGIYIYGRLRYHLATGLSFADAYERTLATTGAGVMLTGLTLATGVASWIAAPLQFQADIGTVLTFLFLVNMIGAVILLPALGAWVLPLRSPEKYA